MRRPRCACHRCSRFITVSMLVYMAAAGDVSADPGGRIFGSDGCPVYIPASNLNSGCVDGSHAMMKPA